MEIMNNKFITLILYFILLFYFLNASGVNPIDQKDFNTIQGNKSISQIKYAKNLQKIENDAESLVLLLISEMSLQKGNAQFALYGYTSLLEKTKDVDVAKRYEEIALDVGAYSLANEIHKKWKEIEPYPSFNQKLIEWQRNIIFKNNLNEIINNFPYIIENANENERRKCFIYISELASIDKNFSSNGYEIIHNYAKKYNNYIESDIADLIFAINSNHKKEAQNVLKKLINKDPTLTPNLALYLNVLISNYLTEIFDSYFKKLTPYETMKLNDFWTTLYVQSLLRNKEIDKAHKIVLKQLDKEPTFENYLQAGYISSLKNKNFTETQNYFEKSYALANKTQRDRVALFAAVSLINLEKFDLATQWMNKIDGNKFPFDKNFIIALCAFNKKDWKLTNFKLKQLNNSKIKNGLYYNQSDLFKLEILTLLKSSTPEYALKELNIYIDNYKNEIIKYSKSKKSQEILIERLSNLIYQRAILLSDKFQNYQEAIKDFKYYKKLNPDDVNINNSLGYTMLKIPNQMDKGMELIKKSYKEDPKSESTNDSLGWAYYLKGEYKKGLPYLEYAYENLPNVETSMHLAAIYYELGNKNKALLLFKKAYEFDNKNKDLLELLIKYNIKIN